MSKTLQVGSEIFEYPDTGDANWGEQSTGWAEKVTEVLETVQGPQDILKTEAAITNGASGNINGLVFDTAQVQQVEIKGYIERVYTGGSGKPTEVESFRIEGAYNGSIFNIAVRYAGDDTGVSIDVDNSGQFNYTAEDKTDTFIMKMVFEAKALTI